ncbi:MAG: PP2C family protein-serine/threonine phosphatase [Bacteroidales bacterium]
MVSQKASLRKLNLSNFKLNSLLELTQAINENLSTEKLLQKYENILCKELNIGKLVVFIEDTKWQTILKVGVPENYSQVLYEDVQSELLCYKEITGISFQREYPFDIFDVIIPVYHKNKPVAYVLIGDIDEDREGISPIIKHLKFIQTITNIIVVAIENKRLYAESLEREVLSKELEVASKMQSMLIPSSDSLPKNPYLNVATYYKPHSQVGGDYYDFIPLSDHEFGFCIADVSGKGVSAALLMSNFQANLRALFNSSIDLVDLIYELNKLVNDNANGEKFITFFIAKYNIHNKSLQYVNAGHNPPLLLHKKKQTMLYLTNGCIGLGMFEEIPSIEQGEVFVDSGDKLVCYTDGLIEAENDELSEFGTIPLEGAISIDGDVDESIHYLNTSLEQFLDGNSLGDDITIIGLDFL